MNYGLGGGGGISTAPEIASGTLTLLVRCLRAKRNNEWSLFDLHPDALIQFHVLFGWTSFEGISSVRLFYYLIEALFLGAR